MRTGLRVATWGVCAVWALAGAAAAGAAVPTVKAISPNNGPAAGGTSVTIEGSEFIAGSKVKFGSSEATGVKIESTSKIVATSPAGSELVDVKVTSSGGTSAAVAKDQFGYDPSPSGLWLGLASNSSYHYLGSTGEFVAHNIVYDRNGHIEWEVGESGEELTKAYEDLERSIEAGMIPIVTIEYTGYPGCGWNGECLPSGTAIKTYYEGFVKIAKELRGLYPGRPMLFEPINEPWGYGTAAQYAEIVAQLLPEVQKAGIPLNTIYVGAAFGARGVKWISKMYEAKSALGKEIQGWYFHPYGPPTSTEKQKSEGLGIESVPYLQKEMTSGQNNIIVSEVGYCTPDVNNSKEVEKECEAARSDGYGAENSTQAAKWLKEALERAKTYHAAGWLRALLVYSRGAGGYAMQLTGGALTKQGEALDSFAESLVGWSVQSSPNPTGAKESSLRGTSCTFSTACVAVGWYENSSEKNVPLAENWSGLGWTVQEPPSPTGAKGSYLYGVSCTSTSACTAAGHFVNSSEKNVPLAERWNGTAWSAQEPPSPTGAKEANLKGVSCTSATACTAAGYFVNSAGKVVPLAESWNGTAWSVQEPPSPTGAKSSALNGVSCTSATACTAVGVFENSSEKYVPLAERWNGTAWSVQEPPSPTGAKAAWLYGVSCTSATACTAAGWFTNSLGATVPLAESWNGTAWSVQEPPNPTGAQEGTLYGLSCISSTACTAVGGFVNSLGANVTLGEANF
jgi:hypothetical protein